MWYRHLTIDMFLFLPVAQNNLGNLVRAKYSRVNEYGNLILYVIRKKSTNANNPSIFRC